LLVPSSSHHPARTRLRFFPQALIAGFGYPLHDVPPQRVQLLTQPVFEVAIVGPTLEHVDHDLEELQKEFHGRPHLRSTMSTRPVQDGEVFFLSIPFHSLCYSNVTRFYTRDQASDGPHPAGCALNSKKVKPICPRPMRKPSNPPRNTMAFNSLPASRTASASSSSRFSARIFSATRAAMSMRSSTRL